MHSLARWATTGDTSEKPDWLTCCEQAITPVQAPIMSAARMRGTDIRAIGIDSVSHPGQHERQPGRDCPDQGITLLKTLQSHNVTHSLTPGFPAARFTTPLRSGRPYA